MAKQKIHELKHHEEPTKKLPGGTKPNPYFFPIKLPTSKRDRWLTAGAALLLLVVISAAIPYSRYAITGHFLKKSVVVTAEDSRTGRPISDVLVKIGPEAVKTDAKGRATLTKVSVGDWTLSANKKYYAPFNKQVNVPLLTSPKAENFRIVALGNQVTIKVTNKITGQPIDGARLTALGATTTTDSSGNAVLVLPVQSRNVSGSLSAHGFNTTPVSIQNSSAGQDAFGIVPVGNIYFLSNASGTINVMSSNLDGSNQKVVLAGTGNEDVNNTELLASRDWHYLALYAKRDMPQPALYLINTANNQTSLIDQGNINFSLVGWDNDYFVYTVLRPEIPQSKPNRVAIKSYDATNGNLNTIYQNHVDEPQEYSYENVDNVQIFNGDVLFSTTWGTNAYWGCTLSENSESIEQMSPTGQNLHSIKSYPEDCNYDTVFGINLIPVTPGQVDAAVTVDSNNTYLKLVNDWGSESTSSISSDTYGSDEKNQLTYLVSPSGKSTFWYERRDGKNTLFTGDYVGSSPKQIASLSDYTPYGWYTDNYVLVSEDKSELYIAPADFSGAPVKITDYYSSGQYINGYGGGYGALE